MRLISVASLRRARSNEYQFILWALALGASNLSQIHCLMAGPPANDDCINAISIIEGDTLFTNVDATTDGPAHVECRSFGSDQVFQDIWFHFTATKTDVLTIGTCGSNFDTRIAVYESCICPAGDANLLACNDDACDLQSRIDDMPVTQGLCYTIRVGSFSISVGSGTLHLSFPIVDPCHNSGHDCCTVGGPSCDDNICCGIVCAVDPFCCDLMWDAECIALAKDLCNLICPPPKCISDATGNSVVDVDDLLLVINSWGPCSGCAADITGNAIVDVDDLLAVINGWGPCE